MKSYYSRTGVRGLIYTLIITTTLVCSLKTESLAMLVPAEIPAGTSNPMRSSDLKTIQGALESKILRERLKQYGLSESEINSRLANMSDKEVHQFASKIHTVSPGGDFTVIGILVFIVLILFIVYLAKRV